MTAEADIWGWARAVDPRIWQAVIAGAFLAIGWIVNGWQTRRAAAALRAERLRDVHRALYAEIGANIANLGSPEALDAHCARTVARIEAEPDFVPFVPKERNDRVFDEIVTDIQVLPRTSIDPVVAYYSQIAAIDALAADMRGLTFPALEPARRVAVFRDYIEMKKQAYAFGEHAKKMINAFAQGGRERAMAEEAEIAREASVSSSAGGRCDP